MGTARAMGAATRASGKTAWAAPLARPSRAASGVPRGRAGGRLRTVLWSPGPTAPPRRAGAAGRTGSPMPSPSRAASWAADPRFDQFGFDPEFNKRVLMPMARVLYEHWFRVQMRGLAHVPGAGPALVVANHSGTLPLDAVMLQTGLHDEHPAHRNLRMLGADLVYEIPLLAALARKGGHTRACPADAHVLLRSGEVVGVFPEGFKGIGKPFTDRYQLRRFGRGGFAVTAHPGAGARSSLAPSSGAEEIYPLLGNATPRGPAAGAAVLPDYAPVPLAGPARGGAAAVEVDHRVLPAGPDHRLRARQRERPGSGRRPERPGARAPSSANWTTCSPSAVPPSVRSCPEPLRAPRVAGTGLSGGHGAGGRPARPRCPRPRPPRRPRWAGRSWWPCGRTGSHARASGWPAPRPAAPRPG